MTTTELTAEIDEPQSTFAELGVPGPLVHVLADEGKRTAFPIQQDTLPDALAGRDVLGRGRTGSGKTLAFSLPLIARLAMLPDVRDAEKNKKTHGKYGKNTKRAQVKGTPHPHGLVLAPTRELANQINEVIAPLAAAYGIMTTTVYGGVRYTRQINDLKDGAQIVVACPGRLEDLVEQGALTLQDVRVVVLDEADEMADMGFLPPIKRILSQIDPQAQHMLFSATLDHGVDGVVQEFLKNPKVHSVDEATSAVDLMTHHVFLTKKQDKADLIHTLASGQGRRILFTRTKFQAKKLAKTLTQQGIPAAELHGNLNQNQRDRNLQAFESGSVNVLVATDVAARGIDVSGVELVVQVDPPDDPKSFLHRSGRTARAGKAGDVITVITPDQRRYSRRLLREAGITVKPLEVTPQSPQVLELVGPVAELVEGWSLPELKRSRPSRAKRGSRRGEGHHSPREARSSRNKKVRKKQVQRERSVEHQRELSDAQREFAQQFLGNVHSVRDDSTPHKHARKEERTSNDVVSNKRKKKSAQSKRNFENGAKRIHRKEQAIVRDERSEEAKRHERRVQAREQASGRKKNGNRGFVKHKRHNKRNAVPFRTR